MKFLLISVIIPAYNAEKYIEETLDSILNQTYQDFEIILIDDGSTDSTAKIMQDYQVGKKAQFHSTRITIISSAHSGAAAARNLGMSVATGQYFLFFDADDIMMPDYLENMIQHIDTENVDIVIGKAEKINENGYTIEEPPKIISLAWEGKYDTSVPKKLKEIGDYVDTITGTKLYKTSIILNNKLRFDNIKVADDVAFFLKYMYFCNSVYVSDNAVMKYRIVNGSLSHNASNNDLDVISCFKKVEKYIAELPGIRDSSFNYFFQNMKIKDYYAWSLHYLSSSASSQTLRKRLFKKFHKEIIKEGKKYRKYLSTNRLKEVKEAEKRYRLSFLYLNRLYIICKRKSKRKESEYI